GQALGTPAYMAPEQAAGHLELIGTRTDVYGLGAILYEILTGQPPFTGRDTDEVLRRVCEDEPVPPRQLCAETPPELEAICLGALAKRPEDRCAEAGQLAQQVHHWFGRIGRTQAGRPAKSTFLRSVSGSDVHRQLRWLLQASKPGLAKNPRV